MTRDLAGLLTAFVLGLALLLGFLALVAVGRDGICAWHGPDSGISYCEERR